jgi:hypothetical protein
MFKEFQLSSFVITYRNSNYWYASSVSGVARDPSTHSWWRSLVNMCGTLLKWQHFNWTEFFTWRKTVVCRITTSLRNEWTEGNGTSVSPFRIKVWIWPIECFLGRNLSVRIARHVLNSGISSLPGTVNKLLYQRQAHVEGKHWAL